MSRIELINASCADQTVDAVVNAANDGLWAVSESFSGWDLQIIHSLQDM